MSELDILIGDRLVKLRDGKTITLRPCKVIQLKKILGLINKYVEQMAVTENVFLLASVLLQGEGGQGLNDAFELLKSCSDQQNTEFYEDLYYDELALLVAKFLEMNNDFFSSMSEKLFKVLDPEPEQSKTGVSESAT